MALVVFNKCRRVTEPCLFPPYPIAQLLFAMVTMMFPMLPPYDWARQPVPQRANGLTDVTIHAVTSRPGRVARARLGANVQRSMNAGFSTTHPPERANARPSVARYHALAVS